MSLVSGKITFRAVLVSVGALYVVYSFLTAQLVNQLPTNWFLTWLGGIFTLMDKEGFPNVWSGLTPGAHYLYFLVWKPAQFITGNQWYFAIVFSLLWYVVSIGAVFVGAYLFYRIVGHIWGETKAFILGTVYLFIFLTFDWYTVIDSISIAALLGAIYSSFKGAGKVGGALLAISAAVKPMGVVILPVIIRSEFMSKKARIAFVATFLSSLAVWLLPFAAGNFRIFMSSLHWQSGRAPWESVYALGLWLMNRPVPNDPFFQDYSGVTPRDWAWPGITPVHAIMTMPVPNYSTWYNGLFLALIATALISFLLLKRVRTETDLLWGGLYTLAMYFGLFYGWSLQFLFWLVPFLLVCLPMAASFFLRIIVLLEYPFFYGLYLARTSPDLVTSVAGMPVSWTVGLAVAGPFGYWLLVALRTVFFLALGVMAWRRLPVQLWEPVPRIFQLRTTLGANVWNALRSRL